MRTVLVNDNKWDVLADDKIGYVLRSEVAENVYFYRPYVLMTLIDVSLGASLELNKAALMILGAYRMKEEIKRRVG